MCARPGFGQLDQPSFAVHPRPSISFLCVYRVGRGHLATTHPPLLQTIINNYRLGSKLGAGSYGSVHVCEDVHNGKKYALKIVDKTKLRKRRLGQSDEELLREVGTAPPLLCAAASGAVYVLPPPPPPPRFLPLCTH